MAILGAKIGNVLGPVGSWAFGVVLGLIRFSVGKQFAIALIETVLQRKGGIDISFKYSWNGIPYGITIKAK